LKPPSASNLSSADLSLLLVSFIPSLDPLLRSLAFLNLSYLSQHPPSPSLSIQYAPLLEDSLISTHPSRLEEALSFFSALLQTNPSEALIVLKRPGLMENIIDLMDLYFLPSSSSSTSTSDPATTATPNVPLALADFCSDRSSCPPPTPSSPGSNVRQPPLPPTPPCVRPPLLPSPNSLAVRTQAEKSTSSPLLKEASKRTRPKRKTTLSKTSETSSSLQ
jgi:hypothetical protein